jgi:high affinity Mn2+ porin
VPESRAALGAPIDVDCPACAAVKPNPASEGPTPSKTPAPRTISQAIHAYCHCLYLRSLGIDVSAQKGTKDQEEEKKDSGAKGEIAPGSRGKTGKTGKTDKDEKEEAKNDKSDNGDNGNGNEEKEAGPAWYSAHAQATVVTQIHQHFFPSPYVGANSLLPSEPAATSITSTLFLATRLWQCGNSTGDLIFDPEIAGGRGFSSVLGLAGFPNGEISRVGLVQPTPYIARLFLRQTWGLGGEQEKVEDAFNQIAGMRDIDRITLVVGKIPATDLVDDNRYSHDPRTQFLNWSLMYNGAWDYPANVRGYDYGAGLEVNRKTWALRYGAFGEPEVANGAAIDPKLFTALGHVIELEERYTWDEHPGHLRLLAFLNHAHMGNYREALAMMPVNPDITLTRAYRIKYGFGLSWDQEITKDLGVFSRLGWNDGHSETWAFTEIDETACLGLVLKGRSWCRPDDTVGLGVVCNGLSSAHRDYLAAGGLGFIIGDGRLNYGLEKILEVYYSVQINKSIFLTFDFQEVDHPAYNRDRGPVAIGTIRVHFEF